MNIRDALQLAIDWHSPDTQAFVATWGHGMSGREMVAILREAAVEHDGTKMPCTSGCDVDDATYCGWDKQWLCSRCTRGDRHYAHRLAFPTPERSGSTP